MMLKEQVRENRHFVREISGGKLYARGGRVDLLQDFYWQRGRLHPLKLTRQRSWLFLAALCFSLFLGMLGLTASVIFWMTGSARDLQGISFLISGFFLVLFFYLI